MTNSPSTARAIKYVIVSPVRNEAAHLDEVISAVVSQTLKPTEWILVDDGSVDATASIGDAWAIREGCVTVVRRPDRGARSPGTGVMEAFYCGYEALVTRDWQFLVKLDGDIVVSPTYFEDCFAEFARDRKLGIAGGRVDSLAAKRTAPETHPSFHVRGATKIYRRECWDALGGLIKSTGWDTVDELKAQYLGWSTRTLPEFPVLHKRQTGSADGAWADAVKNGTANYVAAYHPAFMAAKCLKRLVHKPYGIQSAGLLFGFVRAYIRRAPRIKDPGLVNFIRAHQLRRLLLRNSLWD